MAANLAPFDGGDDDQAMLAAINTTPLVDVMLVLLIIFLITMPVISAAIPVTLPRQDAPVVETGPVVTVSVDRDGRLYWNDAPLAGPAQLAPRLSALALGDSRIHIRGDENTPFAAVAAVIDACRAAGIAKVGFLAQPDQRP